MRRDGPTERRRARRAISRSALGPLAAVAAGAALLVAGLWVGLSLADPGASSQRGEPLRLEGEGFSVDVPGDFSAQPDVEFPLAEAAGADYVGDVVMGLDSRNWVTANSFELDGEVDFSDPATVRRYEDGIWRLFIALSEPLDGKVLAPYTTWMDGHPVVHVNVGYLGPDGEKLNFKAYQVLTPTRGYVIATNAEQRNWGLLSEVGQAALASLEIPQ